MPTSTRLRGEDGLTSLIIVSQQGHVEVARLLVDSGADIDKGAKDGPTPLYIASQEDRVDVS